jgi:tRNA (guanine-N(7)-)-methyltransferase
LFDLNNKFPEFYQFHGRRISKKISESNISLIKNKFEEYSIDKDIIDSLNNKNRNFDLSLKNNFRKIIIEVGFGNGDYLISNAKKNPDFLYIGSEVYINGIAKVLKHIKKFNVNNIKLCGINFLYLLKSLKFKTIDEIYVINPDPWPKKRHNKRRLLNCDNLISMNRLLKKEGKIFISTDSKDYFDEIKLSINNEKQFDKVIFGCMSDSDSMYGISTYQRKAISKEKNIYKIEIFRN